MSYVNCKDDPLVSVIMPNYNKGEFLESSVKSILTQTHQNLELIVIDDGSTDKSSEILLKYSYIDQRVKVKLLNHVGKINAINLGVSLAKGNYIKLFGSDDILYNDAIKKLIINIKDHDLVIHNCSIRDIKKGIILKKFVKFDKYVKINIERVIDGLGLPSGLYFMKSEILKLIFPIPKDATYEDWYIMLMIALNNLKVKILDEVLCDYIMTGKNTFGGVFNHSRDIFLYRTKRDEKMLRLFIELLPYYYHDQIKKIICEENLILSGNFPKILKSEISRKKKIKLLLVKYCWIIYYLYISIKIAFIKLNGR